MRGGADRFLPSAVSEAGVLMYTGWGCRRISRYLREQEAAVEATVRRRGTESQVPKAQLCRVLDANDEVFAEFRPCRSGRFTLSLDLNAVDLHPHPRRIERHAKVFKETMAPQEGGHG
jgi:hypothetical protein